MAAGEGTGMATNTEYKTTNRMTLNTRMTDGCLVHNKHNATRC
jgi:hypothetical protein